MKKNNDKGEFFIFREKEFYCGHLWEKGERDNNEDSLVFWQFSKEGKIKALAMVCDGIGGLSKGEEASSYVVRQVSNWFMAEGYKLSLQKQKMKLQQLCYQMHEELKKYGEEKGIRLGTTMTCVLVDTKKVVWAHYGDCRLYLLKRRSVQILTKEHQKVGKLVRALGVGEWHLFSSGCKRIKKGDRFLLCSDGLYRNIKLEEVRQWGKRAVNDDGEANRMLRQLLERKKHLNEQDNISALYFGYGKREGKGKV